MAHGKLIFENTHTGEVRPAPTGFSWTTLFWGIFPALFRLDWKNLGIMAGVHILVAMFSLGTLNIIPLVVFSFIYNKMYIKDLVNNGWVIDRYEGSKNLRTVAFDVGLDLDRFVKKPV